jgi:hypothetical protein
MLKSQYKVLQNFVMFSKYAILPVSIILYNFQRVANTFEEIHKYSYSEQTCEVAVMGISDESQNFQRI